MNRLTPRRLFAAVDALQPPDALRTKVLAVCAEQTAAPEKPSKALVFSSAAAMFSAATALVLALVLLAALSPRLFAPEDKITGLNTASTSFIYGNIATEIATEAAPAWREFPSVSQFASWLAAETDWAEVFVPSGEFSAVAITENLSEICFFPAEQGAAPVSVFVFASAKEAKENAAATNAASAGRFVFPLTLENNNREEGTAGLLPLSDFIKEEKP